MSDVEYPSIHWKKWFEKFPEIETKPIAEWQVVHILSYWNKKYKDYYGFDFTWTMSGAPTKSYDAVLIKKIGQMLSTKPNILKDYIDWIFENKIQSKQKKITSLGYLAHKELVNDFKFNVLFKSTQITRSTPLPELWKDLLSNHGYDSAETYGDLAFIKMHAVQDQSAQLVIEKIASTGFNTNTLDSLS